MCSTLRHLGSEGPPSTEPEVRYDWIPRECMSLIPDVMDGQISFTVSPSPSQQNSSHDDGTHPVLPAVFLFGRPCSYA